MKDLRKYSKESNKHKDFIISSRYNPRATFVIRGVRPVISTEIDVYKRISDNTRYYSVEILNERAERIFRSIDWKQHYQGTSMPTVSIPDCIAIYQQYLEASDE